jgi:hypothetical protein
VQAVLEDLITGLQIQQMEVTLFLVLSLPLVVDGVTQIIEVLRITEIPAVPAVALAALLVMVELVAQELLVRDTPEVL